MSNSKLGYQNTLSNTSLISCTPPRPLVIKCWHFVYYSICIWAQDWVLEYEIQSQCPSILCSPLPKWLFERLKFKFAYVCKHDVNLVWIGELGVKPHIYIYMWVLLKNFYISIVHLCLKVILKMLYYFICIEYGVMSVTLRISYIIIWSLLGGISTVVP